MSKHGHEAGNNAKLLRDSLVPRIEDNVIPDKVYCWVFTGIPVEYQCSFSETLYHYGIHYFDNCMFRKR